MESRAAHFGEPLVRRHSCSPELPRVPEAAVVPPQLDSFTRQASVSLSGNPPGSPPLWNFPPPLPPRPGVRYWTEPYRLEKLLAWAANTCVVVTAVSLGSLVLAGSMAFATSQLCLVAIAGAFLAEFCRHRLVEHRQQCRQQVKENWRGWVTETLRGTAGAVKGLYEHSARHLPASPSGGHWSEPEGHSTGPGPGDDVD